VESHLGARGGCGRCIPARRTHSPTSSRKEGASLDQYVRIANDILFNPEGTIERVSDDLQEKVDQFEEREDALRERFQDAMS
jgi:hypothetical protein